MADPTKHWLHVIGGVVVALTLGCAMVGGKSPLEGYPTIQAFLNQATNVRSPIGGSYSQGAEMIRAGKGKDEARALFRQRGSVFLSPVDSTMVGMSLEREKKVFGLIDSGKALLVRVPGLIHVASSKLYYEEAQRFMIEFNEEMCSLSGL